MAWLRPHDYTRSPPHLPGLFEARASAVGRIMGPTTAFRVSSPGISTVVGARQNVFPVSTVCAAVRLLRLAIGGSAHSRPRTSRTGNNPFHFLLPALTGGSVTWNRTPRAGPVAGLVMQLQVVAAQCDACVSRETPQTGSRSDQPTEWESSPDGNRWSGETHLRMRTAGSAIRFRGRRRIDRPARRSGRPTSGPAPPGEAEAPPWSRCPSP